MRVGVLALVVVSGCAFVFTDGPSRPYDPATEPDCTEDSGVALLDMFGAVSWGVIGVAGTTIVARADHGGGLCQDPDPSADPNDDKLCSAALWIGGVAIVAATVQGISAHRGFGKVRRCRDAVKQRRQYKIDHGIGGPIKI